MKRISLVIGLFFITAISTALADNSDKMLGVNETNICDHKGSGSVVQLRGVNLGGWLEWQDWMCPISSAKLPDTNPGHNGYDFEVRRLLTKRFGPAVSEDLINSYEDAWITELDLDHIKALGMNVIRLTFAYDTIANEDGTIRNDAFKRLDWLVQKAWDRGIYTILDYHAFLPANQDGATKGYWSDTAHMDETVKLWTQIATHYQGNPAVAMYDLLNEPNNSAPKGKPEPKAQVVCNLYDRLYKAIRDVDPDHIIAMEGVWDWKTLRDPNSSGYHNVVYSFHWYHWGNKNAAQNNEWTDNDIHNVAEMQKSWKIPSFIGEFNLFGDAEAWNYALAAYQKAGVSWTIWTYKNTASDTNSWGVYTTLHGKAPPVPNLMTDSAEEIKAKWSAWVTSDQTFALNPMLGPILSKP